MSEKKNYENCKKKKRKAINNKAYDEISKK